MSKKLANKDQDVNLSEIIKTINKFKFRIILITFITTLISAYNYKIQPSSFSFVATIMKSPPAIFTNYISLNNILRIKGYSYFIGSNSFISSDTIFERFVTDFNDYQEMMYVLKENSFVTENLAELDSSNRKKALFNLAKSFKISLSEDKQTVKAYFEWHNETQGSQLLDQAIQKTLENVKLSLLKEVNEFYKIMENKKKIQLRHLNTEAELALDTEKLKLENEIFYLEQQSKMAKELEIEGFYNSPFLEENGFVKSLFFSEQTYLRGFMALDKEIELKKSLIKNGKNIMSSDYYDIQARINQLKTDSSLLEIETALSLLQSDNHRGWINYNLSFANITSLKLGLIKSLMLGIILGLILGLIYALMSNINRILK